MNGVNVCIPSFNRAGRVLGYSYFLAAKIVIPESQRDDYAKHYDASRLIVIPDDQDGSLPKKRNWILRNVPRPLVMIDDDVRCLVTTEGEYDSQGHFLGRSRQKIRLTTEEAEKVIIQGFNLAHEWGIVYWGLNVNTDGRNYQQYKPFSLSQVVLDPFTGHLTHDLFYDEAVGTKLDYDFSLQALNRYRKILRMNKYAYDCEHGTNPGGLVGMRTMEMEAGFCRAIERKWGRQIIKYPHKPKKLGDLLNGTVSIPISGV